MKPPSVVRWFLAGIFIFSLAGWFVSGLLLYARLAYLSIILIVGSGIFTYYSLPGIKLTRQARILRASVGEVFEEHFEIRNSSWIPCLWLEIINQSNLPMAGGSRVLTGIGRNQRRFYTARTLLYRRGAFLLGPTSLSSGDPFGFFNSRKRIEAKDTLLVMPMIFPDQGISSASGTPAWRKSHQITNFGRDSACRRGEGIFPRRSHETNPLAKHCTSRPVYG